MSSVNYKYKLYEQFARTGKALSSAARLELLEFLAQGERNVDSLTKASGLTKANVSQHLQQLKAAGLVTARKKGLHVYYSLSDEMIIDLVALLRTVTERNVAEVDRIVDAFLHVKDDLEPVPAKELWKRAKDGLVTVLDVRPHEEYEAGHIPGAVNIPLKKLGRQIKELPKSREVVAYCRGPYCVLSYEAVEYLRKKGYTARRLKDGMPEWKNSRLPVDVS